jgi:tRNA splicing endonuclease
MLLCLCSRAHVEDIGRAEPACTGPRYAVYCDLWSMGCYITSGAKFGGDYLLYAGG